MNGDNSFSFDVYPGLDADLEAAYARNQAQGTVSPGDIATAGIEAAVQTALEQREPDTSSEDLPAETQAWAHSEMTAGFNALWPVIQELIVPPPPMGGMNLSPNQVHTINELHKARLALGVAAGENPEGENVGESMHLTFVPWQDFRDHLHDLPERVKQLRTAQGVATVDDYFNDDLLSAINSDAPIYRNPIAPHFFATNNTTAPEWISAKDYLDQRIAEDGPWGIILTQTSEAAGLQTHLGKSPDELTDKGGRRLEIAGHKVDGLGIFEWLAMSYQHDPSTLSPKDVSWLLANRIEDGGDPGVPFGYWDGARVRSVLRDADRQYEFARPRLAVI